MTPLFATSIYWHLPVLLIAFSLVYSATRHDRWDRILWEAVGWAIRIFGFLASIGVGLWLLQRYPDQWPYFAVGGGIVAIVYYLLTSRKSAPEPEKKP